MKLLLLTFYYPPDLCAGSFRAASLAEALQDVAGGELEIDVMTTMPNRYQSFNVDAEPDSVIDGIRVRRIPVPTHQSGMMDQSRVFARFARGVLRETRGESWDLVVATSARLMTGVLAARVSRRIGVPLYLDIRDLFRDVMGDLLPPTVAAVAMPILRVVERRTMRAATKVNLVSEGFRPYMSQLVSAERLSCYPNGIDSPFLIEDFARPEGKEGRLVVYAGNIGAGQGLDRVVPEAAGQVPADVRFRLIGDGGTRTELESALRERGLTNVEVVDPVDRSELIRHYREASVLFLHLNDHPAFENVLPSKIFEYAATGKPILAGVAGYAARFLNDQVAGAEVFDPCDPDGLVASLERLRPHGDHVDRSDFRRDWARDRIVREMANDVLDTGFPRRSRAPA